jgi:prephenate dehydrogenase
MFNKVTIVGVGLIGGSIGLAIKKRKLAKLVMGVVRRRETIAKAFRRRALHGATMNLKEGVRDADLVILCAPVSMILQQLKVLRPMLGPKTRVIDVASSKLLVDLAAQKYLKGVRFVGCHPMAGAAKSGLEHANADMFKNAGCFMTNADKVVDRFWRALGAHTHILTPKSHDEWVARVSHLPHILAFALFQSGGIHKLTRLGIEACNPSIQDLARLSKSDPKLWADILLSNKKEILDALREHELGLRYLKRALSSKNARQIKKFILQANAASHRLAPNRIQPSVF